MGEGLDFLAFGLFECLLHCLVLVELLFKLLGEFFDDG